MADIYEYLEAKDVNYQDPAHVALRIWMKENFLVNIRNSEDPFKKTLLENSEFVIYGTTLITIGQMIGMKFPYAGQKSGDIDISVCPPGDCMVGRDKDLFIKEFQKVVKPFLLDVMKRTGLSQYDPKDILGDKSPEIIFNRPFMVARNFTPDQAESVFKDLNLDIPKPQNNTHVSMEIDLIAQPPLSPLKPLEVPILSGGSTGLKIDDWRHLLSKKIARAASPKTAFGKVFQHSNDPNGFKPRDLIDIYNLVNADPQVVNLNKSDPNNDIGLMRVLSLVYFARYDHDKIKVDSKYYEPTEENINSFIAALDRRISDAHELDHSLVKKVFETYHEVLEKVFPEIVKDRKEEVQIDPKEKQFLTEIRGYRIMPSGGTAQTYPSIEVDLLRELHPEVFKNHPEMLTKIAGHPTLKAIGQQVMERRSGMEY